MNSLAWSATFFCDWSFALRTFVGCTRPDLITQDKGQNVTGLVTKRTPQQSRESWFTFAKLVSHFTAVKLTLVSFCSSFCPSHCAVWHTSHLLDERSTDDFACSHVIRFDHAASGFMGCLLVELRILIIRGVIIFFFGNARRSLLKEFIYSTSVDRVEV